MITASEISNLLKTSEWKKLGEIPHESERFNLFKHLEENVCENSWSRVLAFLFKSKESHNLGVKPIEAWLKAIKAEIRSTSLNPLGRFPQLPLAENCETNAKFNWRAYNKRTDRFRFLDVLIEIKSNGNVIEVIGIETKLWSSESKYQLRDYQDAIVDKYPNYPKTLIFLTPEGKAPKTANDNCLCVSCSYATIPAMIKEIIPNGQSELQILLASMRDFINQQILGVETMNHEAKKLIRSLYQNGKHQRVLKEIRNYNPGLEMAEDLKKAVEGAFTKIHKPDWGYHPKNCKCRTPQEIKLHPREFYDRAGKLGFTIVYMLNSDRINPDIEDEYRMFVGAWAERESGLKAANIFAKKLAFEKPGNAPDFRDWKFFWEGQSYKLQDFGKKDIDNLKSIFIEALEKTYDRIERKLR